MKIFKLWKRRKALKFDSLTALLVLIKKQKLPYDVSSKDLNGHPPLLFVSELDVSIAQVAIQSGFIHGLETTEYQYIPAFIVDNPVLTPSGEIYLRDQSIFKKYPIIEKTFTIILTGVVSAITTLLINYFVNQ